MIKELVQFVNEIPEYVVDMALEPKKGFHTLICFDDAGLGKVMNVEYFQGEKHGQISNFLKQCASKQEAAWMIDTNKCFDLPTKGIHTASPFSIGFKAVMSKADKNNKVKSKELSKLTPTKQYKISIAESVVNRLDAYFEKSLDPKFGLNEINRQKITQFKYYLKRYLTQLFEDTDLDWDEYFLVYLEEPLEEYKLFQKFYLTEGIFNTSDYNIEIDSEIFGTSNFYNGFNSKKPFLMHHTAPFDITSRISASNAKALSDFKTYANKKLFPNPIPIFIDKPEMTKDAIKVYHRNADKKSSHREIISELWKREEDLGNYYLLYFSGGAIQDFDYVSKFKYLLSNEKDNDGMQLKWSIMNVTELKNKEKNLLSSIKLKTVFDFERIVIRELFNNSLVKVDEKKGTVSMRYLDDIDAKWYRPAMFSLILKYRKSVYDFIYKSIRSSIGRSQFEDICLTSIMDDIRSHDNKNEYTIKLKLNIYFSLHADFDRNNNQKIMPSKIEEYKAEIAKVAVEEDAHFITDEAYAFGAGQLIYFLLSKSEASDRTHALLEPFLQKTNHAHFNEAISNTLLKYKHAIGFDFKRFNQLAGEVLAYEPDGGLQILRPYLLAGYFCPNILYTKKIELQS
jgi:CRISPR-associated protein Csh1